MVSEVDQETEDQVVAFATCHCEWLMAAVAAAEEHLVPLQGHKTSYYYLIAFLFPYCSGLLGLASGHLYRASWEVLLVRSCSLLHDQQRLFHSFPVHAYYLACRHDHAAAAAAAAGAVA